MATEFFIHKMTEHMETARILRWLVKEGESVNQYQILMEVETEKAAVEIEAPVAGIIRNIRPDAIEGAEIKVGETICLIAEPGEILPSPVTQKTEQDRQTLPQVLPESVLPPDGQSAISPDSGFGEIRATPLARRIAKDLEIDLVKVKGSGPKGIIRDEDVRAFAAQKSKAPLSDTDFFSDASALTSPAGVPPVSESGQLMELNKIQAITGQRMLQSIQSAPQLHLTLEADMTNFLWIQEALSERVQAKTGLKLSITTLLVRVVAEVLKDHPLAHASFEESPGGRPSVRLHPQINIGVAIGTEAGLIVPVIRQADLSTIEEIARILNSFIEKSQGMHFTPTDLEGGTFTLSNLGMVGILQFNAILNPPQSAILAIGKIVRRAVALPEGGIGLRPIMSMTLTIDHRVMDGMHGARFLADIQSQVEKPYFLL
jgi:pyruvate dehydrogenase E2 component (dihydrolipoamide acetyltransferase)